MAEDRPDWSPEQIDISQPSVARVYDYVLGGSHNFAADREFGRRALESYPAGRLIARDHRAFLQRAVLYAVEAGIDQFVDLGSGIPTFGNVHEVAQGVLPEARVFYVERDPVAVTHSLALLRSNPYATAVRADIRDHRHVLAQIRVGGLIDLGRPVAVLMVAVAHFLEDADRPAELIDHYMRATPTGSVLAVSHARGDGHAGMTSLAEVYQRADSPGRVRLRSRDEITALFGDLDVVPPGVVSVPGWRPDPGGPTAGSETDDDTYPGLAGVGRRT